MKIIALTLNPAYDVHWEIENYRPFHSNYIRTTYVEAGGKGVNVSRALKANGIPNSLFVAMGRKNSSAFEGALLDAGIRYSGIFHDGKIRENIIIHSEGMEDTRISFDGVVGDEDLMDQAEYLVLSDCDADTVLVFCGRVPRGISVERVRAFLAAVKETGARVVINSNSFSVADCLKIQPYMIKPNREELSLYKGREIDSLAAAEEVANELHATGIEHVLVSMGQKGIAYAGRDGHFTVTGEKINTVSSTGAGDSTLAGFLAGQYKGFDVRSSVRLALAFGNASCMEQGTRPPLPQNVHAIYENLK